MRNFNINAAEGFDPWTLAIQTGQAKLRSPMDAMGMGGVGISRTTIDTGTTFVSNLVIPGIPPELAGTEIGAIIDTIRGVFRLLFGSHNRDVHIEAQEEAANGIIAIANNIDTKANSGILTRADLEQGIAGVSVLAHDFTLYVDACIGDGNCHSERATRGKTEVSAMAANLAESWYQAVLTYFPNGAIPAGNGSPLPDGISNIIPWIIGGALLLKGG